MESLTDEQNNALSRFREFTHIDSVDTCHQYLTAHEWDVERAIETALVSNTDFPSPETNQHYTTNSTSFVSDLPEERVNPPPTINQVAQHLVPNNDSPSIFYVIFSFLFTLCLKIQAFFQGIFHLFYSFLRSLFTTVLPVDPIAEIDEYCNYFDQKYGSQHPAFYRGKLTQALQDAQREIRLLFIYIHHKNSAQCDRFCREVLCEDALRSVIGDNLLWSSSTDSQEGANACRLLNAYTFPCFCIIAHHGSQQTVQLKLHGYTDPDEFLAEVFNGFQHADQALEYNRQQRNNSSSRSRLVEEQNEAYLESLRTDLEKAEKRKQEEIERLKLEEEQRRSDEEKQKKLQEVAAFRDKLRLSLTEEPSATETDVVQVSIRLPSSEPIRRRFRRSESIKALFEFAWTNSNVPDRFELLWGYPRKRYQYDQIEGKLLADVMSDKTETCFLEEIDDE